jgi:hypothetical protein
MSSAIRQLKAKLIAFMVAMLFAFGFANGQTLYDSFTDGNFTATPVWGGNTSDWSIVANSDAAAGATGSNTVRLSAAMGTATRYLSSQISTWSDNQEWGFWVGRRSQAFTTANQMYIWLYANEANLTSSTVDGYRLQIGDDSDDDEIRLQYIVNGAVSATVITSSDALTNGIQDIGFLIRVTRNSTGNWTLYTSALPTTNGTGAIATDIPSASNTGDNQGSGINNLLVPSSNGYIGIAALHSTGGPARATVEFDQVYFTTCANPGVTCPSSENAGTDVNCQAEVPDFTENTIVAGGCGSVTVTQSPLAGVMLGVGTHPISITATDGLGNIATCNTSFIVIDNTAPVLDAAPGPITVECLSLVPAMTSLNWTDNCDAGGSVLGVDGPLTGGACGGTITRTWNVSDACGNPAITRTQIITVDDNTAPLLDPAPGPITVECLSLVPAMTSLNWTDNCDAGGSVEGVDGELVGGACGGTITRTWNVSDACGNPAITRTQIITVDDNTAPVLDAAPGPITVECLSLVPEMTSLNWSDNCDAGGSVEGVDGPLTGGACGGTITRIWNVSDACGNPAITRTQIITVDDNTAPVLDAAPGPITVECLSLVPGMTSLNWTDNCDAGGSVEGVDGELVGGACGGTITRTWNVSDACGNPAITRTQIITVDDNTAPVLDPAPGPITVECLSLVPAMTSLNWTDNCDAGGSVEGVDGPLTGGACGGTITRTWNVSDACGNPAITRTQIITVDDNTAPVLDAAPGPITVECLSLVPAMTSLNWTDNCDAGGSVEGVDGPLTGGACGGTITRTWNVSDACGNPAITRTQIITVDDNTAPVLDPAPGPITVECLSLVPAMTSLNWTDNCDAGGSVEGVDGELVGGACGGTITRTWNVSDACGNPAITRTQIITVDDNTAPVLDAAPAPITVECVSLVPAMTSLNWTDNCDAGGSVEGVDGPLTGGACGGTITRTWNVSDACGNPAITRTQIITVDDNTAPVLDAAPGPITVECLSLVPAMTSLNWTDNCDAGGSVEGVDGPLTGGACGGTITRTWNVSDACGNPAITRTQIITVDDNTAPVLDAAPGPITVECLSLVPAMTSLSWTDNCDAGGSVEGVDGPLTGGACGGTITRTWNVSDACGNPAITRTQIITVDDNTAPVLDPAPGPITVECLSLVPAMTSLNWSDNCDAGGSVLGVDGPLTGGACGGTITRTWNVSDACGNPAITRTQIITVDDNTAPVLDAAPGPITVECLSLVPAMTSLNWTDNCDAGGSVEGVDGPLTGGACGGTITRTWNVSDACGNPAITRTQIITVDDNTAPVLDAAPGPITVECLSLVPAMTSLNWTDNCDAGGSVEGVDGELVGGACGGTITRTWNVSDACGNPAITRTQIITVDDNTAPVLDPAPGPITVECLSLVPAMTSLNWTDNCDAGGSVEGVDGPLTGGACGGTITRTWNVSDACGNPAITRTQIITVDDNTAPVLDAAPGPITVECLSLVPAMTSLNWSDNCDAGGSVEGVDGPLTGGACGGTITRTWNVSDACGNPAITRTQIITVDDNTAPVLDAAPGPITVECLSLVPAMTSLNWTDNCDAGGSVEGVDGPLTGGACGGTITRTWNVSDACGNPAITRTQIITVDDNTAPVLDAAPGPITVECLSLVPAMTSLNWTDNCDAGGSVEGVDGELVGGACGGTITRTWNVSDACGNPAITRTQIITVDDNTAPVLDAAPGPIAVECLSLVPAMTSLNWSDNCDAGGSVEGVDGPLTGGACGGTITRTWNVSDACGNPAITRTQIITVDDNTAPILDAAPGPITVECLSLVPAMTSLNWTDNCDAGGSVEGVDGPLTGGACGGTITRTWNVSDACGNPAITRTQIITVDDNTAPVLDAAPGPITVECLSLVPAMTSLNWTDNCDASGSVEGVDGPLTGGACGGTITRTWNVSDACGNPAITRTQIITVDDNTAPVLDAAPGPITVECLSLVPAMTSLNWTDNCDAGGSVEGVDGSLVGGACGGTITRTWNVSDACGNPAITRTQIITVDDNTAPILDAAPGPITVECLSLVPAMTSLNWTDNCDAGGSVEGVDGPLTGGACGGTITRTWNVSDACGNPAIARTQIITVDDNTAPVITVPANININFNPAVCGAVVNYTVSALDNCSGVVPANLTAGLASGSVFPIGTTTVTHSAQDDCGNLSNKSFTVTVNPLPITPIFTLALNPQQYSDTVRFKVVIPNGVSTCGNAAVSATFTVSNGGSQEMGTANFLANGANLEAILTAPLYEVPNSSVMAPGTKTASVSMVLSNTTLYTVDNVANQNLVVTKENAPVEYNGVEYFTTSANSCPSNGNIVLSAYIEDTSDVYRGDIRKATVTFNDENGNAYPSSSNLPVGLVNPGNLQEGIATSEFTKQLSGGDCNTAGVTFEVWVKANNYYTGASQTGTLITLALPGQDNVTGGGHLNITNSAGCLSATPGSKMNFGLSMKTNKSGKNLQGQITILFRKLVGGTWKTYKIKSNAINSMSVQSGGGYNKAIIATKANLSDVTNPLAPISLGGNLNLAIEAWDYANDNGGQLDKIAVSLSGSITDCPANGLIFASSWTAGSSVAQLLGGGNINVKSSATPPPANSVDRFVTSNEEPAAKPTAIDIAAVPNPTSNFFIVSVRTLHKEMVDVRVYDMTGKVVERASGHPMELYRLGEKLVNGIYLVEVIQGKERATIKVVKGN